MPQDASRDRALPVLATAKPAPVEANLPGWSFVLDSHFEVATFRPYRGLPGLGDALEVRVALNAVTFQITGTDCRFPSKHWGFIEELPEEEKQAFVATDIERTRQSLGAKLSATLGQGGRTGQASTDLAAEREATGSEQVSTESSTPRRTILTMGDESCMRLRISATRQHQYLEGSLPRKRVGTAEVTGSTPRIHVTMTIASDEIDIVARINGRYRRSNRAVLSRLLVRRAFCGRRIQMAQVDISAGEGKADAP